MRRNEMLIYFFLCVISYATGFLAPLPSTSILKRSEMKALRAEMKPLAQTQFGTKAVAKAGILFCACVYGSNFAVIKSLDAAMVPSVSASLRFGVATVASLTAVPILRRYSLNLKINSKLWSGALQAGLVNSAGYMCQAIGLEGVDASVSAFVCSLAVVVVPLLDHAILGNRIARSTWIGATMAAFGVMLLAFDGYSDSSLIQEDPHVYIAIFATALQPFLFGLGFWLTERVLLFNSSTDTHDIDSKNKKAISAALCCAAAQLACLKITADIWLGLDLLDGNLPLAQLLNTHPDQTVWAELVWTGLIATCGTIFIETLALSRISASESTLLFCTEPVFGAIFSVAFLHEHLGILALCGATIVLLACASTALTSSSSSFFHEKHDSLYETMTPIPALLSSSSTSSSSLKSYRDTLRLPTLPLLHLEDELSLLSVSSTHDHRYHHHHLL